MFYSKLNPATMGWCAIINVPDLFPSVVVPRKSSAEDKRLQHLVSVIFDSPIINNQLITFY